MSSIGKVDLSFGLNDIIFPIVILAAFFEYAVHEKFPDFFEYE